MTIQNKQKEIKLTSGILTMYIMYRTTVARRVCDLENLVN
jgi:hypothetical protein